MIHVLKDYFVILTKCVGYAGILTFQVSTLTSSKACLLLKKESNSLTCGQDLSTLYNYPHGVSSTW